MTKKEIYELFQYDSSQIQIDAKRKEQSLLLLNQAIEDKRIVPLASKREILKGQMRFLDYKLMVLQGICVLLLLLIFRSMHSTIKEELLYLLVTASAPVFGMFMAIACNREEVQGMAELTGSCFFNYRQVCILRMILYGIVNLLTLTCLSSVLCTYLKRSVVEIGIYFLVPFLMTGCVQFAMLLAGFGLRNNYVQAAGGLFMTAVWSGTAVSPQIYERTALTVWVVILVICMAGFGMEITAVLKRIERGDLLCMN